MAAPSGLTDRAVGRKGPAGPRTPPVVTALFSCPRREEEAAWRPRESSSIGWQAE